MARKSSLREACSLLERFRGGQASINWNRSSLVVLDADQRNVEVDIGPLVHARHGLVKALNQGHMGGLESIGVPGYLASLGWKVTLKDGGQPLLWLGRDVSALTGHVHVKLRALRELTRML
jgi:hypothetical protein